MDRRKFITTGATTLAAGALAQTALAQNAQRPAAGAAARAAAPQAAPAAAPAAAGPVKKLRIDTYTRHLQWLRSANEVADAVLEMGYEGVDITVRPYPGHVDPATVARDLPPFVNTLRSNGLQVSQMACPIIDAETPFAEAILDTAASVGIHHYWGGNWQYDLSKPYATNIEALKPRVERLVALNRKYNAKFMSHTRSGATNVGNMIFDALELFRGFDPRYVSLHWDAGHSTNAGGNGTWALGLRAAGPYVGGVSLKDSMFKLDLETPEGGVFTGTPESLNPARPPGGGPGGPPGGPPAGAPPAQGPPQGAAPAGGGQGAAGGPGGGPGGPGGGAPGGPGGGGGPGGQRQLGRGGGGQPNPWRVVQTPMGMGQVDLPMVAQVLKEIRFDGPVEIQAEYPNGGANNAADKITLPRAIVLGNMKRDLLTVKAAWAASGLV